VLLCNHKRFGQRSGSELIFRLHVGIDDDKECFVRWVEVLWPSPETANASFPNLVTTGLGQRLLRLVSNCWAVHPTGAFPPSQR
jgi:hypothetical protein